MERVPVYGQRGLQCVAEEAEEARRGKARQGEARRSRRQRSNEERRKQKTKPKAFCVCEKNERIRRMCICESSYLRRLVQAADEAKEVKETGEKRERAKSVGPEGRRRRPQQSAPQRPQQRCALHWQTCSMSKEETRSFSALEELRGGETKGRRKSKMVCGECVYESPHSRRTHEKRLRMVFYAQTENQ